MSQITAIQPIEIPFINDGYAQTRHQIMQDATKHFGLESFVGDYKRAVIYKHNHQEEIAELQISSDNDGILIVFLPAQKMVRYFLFKAKSACCIGYNEDHEKTFDYQSYLKSVVYHDYASCWDCADYNDHSTERESFKVVYNVETGKCETQHYCD